MSYTRPTAIAALTAYLQAKCPGNETCEVVATRFVDTIPEESFSEIFTTKFEQLKQPREESTCLQWVETNHNVLTGMLRKHDLKVTIDPEYATHRLSHLILDGMESLRRLLSGTSTNVIVDFLMTKLCLHEYKNLCLQS